MKNGFLVLLLCSQLVSFSQSHASDCFNPKEQPFSKLKSGNEVMYYSASGFKRAGNVVSIEKGNIYAVEELNFGARENVVNFNQDAGSLVPATGIWTITKSEDIYKKTNCVVVDQNQYRPGDVVKIRRGKGPRSHQLRILKVYENGTALVGMNDREDIYGEYQVRGDSMFENEVYELYVVSLN
ncbi:MAG: hypothetical protein QE271_08410 [Bacteriovoracaceae bacterium]|nr:hypothetical protein [Bacteriovoracaceae bacterium]